MSSSRIKLMTIVTFFIGLLLGGALSPYILQFLDTEESMTKATMEGLKRKLYQFKQECGEFPSNRNGLKALITPSIDGCSTKRQFISMLPQDFEGEDFTYIKKENGFYIIASMNNKPIIVSN